MGRRFLVFICVAALAIAGCSMKPAGSPMRARDAYGSASMRVVHAGPPERYVAERHKLDILTSDSELQKAWESAVADCAKLQCEVVSSTISARTADSPPAGKLFLRVAPSDLNSLLSSVSKPGTVAEHTTEREDKTTQVVDTDAKIKNLTAFRDNLRAMLARPGGTVRDTVEIQRQLTDTQAQLDSETAQRKILANETEKIAVEISFRVERQSGNGRGFAEIWDALRNSGGVLAESTASLVIAVFALIPWLLLIVPFFWLCRKTWKRWKQRIPGYRLSA